MTQRVQVQRIEASTNTPPPGAGLAGELGLFLPTGAGKPMLYAGNGTAWSLVTEGWPSYIDLSPHAGEATIGAAVTAFGTANVPDSPVFANWNSALYVLTNPATPGATGSWRLLQPNSFSPTADFAGDIETLSSGVYWVTSAATNTPIPRAGTLYVALRSNGLSGSQLFISAEGRTYQRIRTGGAWVANWTPLHNTESIFTTVEEMIQDTQTYSDPDIIEGGTFRVRAFDKDYTYAIASSAATDHHLLTNGGIKLYVRGDVLYPQMLGTIGHLPGLGIPTADEKPMIDLCVQIAAARGMTLDFRGYTYRYEGTLGFKVYTATNIASANRYVSTIRGNNCNFFQPMTSTFSQFYEDDGITPSNDVSIASGDRDSMRIALDVGGGPYNFEGHFVFRTIYLNRFRSDERAQIAQNLSFMGGVREPCVELNFLGKMECEGYTYDRYVPEVTSGRSSRQFARTTGVLEATFCLAELGYFGASANGGDDNFLNRRATRCGHFGAINTSLIRSTEQVYAYCFITGLTDKTANPDTETLTISITHNSLNATLSGDHLYLQSGDYICIPDAYELPDGTMIPWVARISLKVGALVTFDAKTRPYLPTAGTLSNANWFYRPPQITLNFGSLVVTGSAYWEGYRHGIRMMESSHISMKLDAKVGADKMSGLYGVLIQVDGFGNVIEIESHRQNHQTSRQLRGIFSYPMMYETVSGAEYDCPVRAEIGHKFAKNGSAAISYLTAVGVDPVAPATGVNPRTIDTSRSYTGIYVLSRYTDGATEGFFAPGGALEERTQILSAGTY